MAETPTSTGAQSELSALRVRAYGPNPDIQDDPIALARLSELEWARTAVATAPASGADRNPTVMEIGPTMTSAGEPPSLWHRATSTTPGRLGLVVGTAMIALGLIWTTGWLLSPRPDATLAATGEGADSQILNVTGSIPGLQFESSTLRGYEAYRGLDLWFALDTQGFECLIAIERASHSLIAANCVPSEADLRLEVGGYPEADEVHYEDGLTPGSVIRFTMRGPAVDVFLFPARAAG